MSHHAEPVAGSAAEPTAEGSVLDVPVIDAHHHLARLSLGYPWLGDDAPTDRYHGDDRPLRTDYLLSDYRADTHDLPLIASVHVENGAADALAEARWLGEVIAEHAPVPAAHVAQVDLSAENVPQLLDELAAMPHVRGIRHILNWHADPRFTHTDRPGIMNEPTWRSNFARLAALGLSFDLQVFGDQLGAAAGLLAEYPDVSVILDHAGMPVGRDTDTLRRWRLGLGEVAARENVTVKISALGTTDHRWSVESIRPIVHDTIAAFGPERVMFGSNFPVDGLYSTLPELYRAFAQLTAEFSRAERAAMFAGTAARAYRIEGLLEL